MSSASDLAPHRPYLLVEDGRWRSAEAEEAIRRLPPGWPAGGSYVSSSGCYARYTVGSGNWTFAPPS